jgi:hypothetical protein
MIRPLALCSVLALALVSCGNPAPTAQETASNTAAPATEPSATAETTAAATPDACDLVTPDELAAIFTGRSFAIDNTSPAPRNTPASPGRNAITSCTFVSPGASVKDMITVSVILTTAPSDKAQQTIDRMKAGVASLGMAATPVDIAGLGDGAYWVNLGSDRRSGVAVNVQRNPRYWLSVSESSSGQEEATTVSRLTEIARQALGRL